MTTKGNRQQQQQKRRYGPQTEAGRLAVRGNAVQHGILSAELVIAALGESQEELDDLRERLWRAWEPQGLGEEMVAEQILVMYWRLRRVLVAEKGLLTQRQRATLDRLLLARRAGPPGPPMLGGTGGTLEPTEGETAALEAVQLLSGDDVERVARYESHLMRRLSALIAELTFMQARRLANEGRVPARSGGGAIDV